MDFCFYATHFSVKQQGVKNSGADLGKKTLEEPNYVVN